MSFLNGDITELIKAHCKAWGELNGICLTNSDPEADYVAVVEKNRAILQKFGLSTTDIIEKIENNNLRLTVILSHIKSGQFTKSETIIPLTSYDDPDVFLLRRIMYEGLLGIFSSNNAIEADLFGPKRKHKELVAPYDKTADFIEFVHYDQDGNVYERRVDRRKFEKSFLGMTTEEEQETKFEIPERRELSWSNIRLFLQCKRCFYIEKKLGIKGPISDSDAFALPKAVDLLLKKEFDQYRMNEKQHPVMVGINIPKPLKHKKLNKWRRAWSFQDKRREGIQYNDVWGNWLACGAVDDVWINDLREIVVVDYKTIVIDNIKKHGTKAIPYIEEYKKQLDFYAWLFKKNNYNVSPTSYLLFCNALTNKDIFDWRLEFEPYLLPHQIDDSWVQETIYDALACLNENRLPEAGKNCKICTYFMRVNAVSQRINPQGK